MNDICYIELYVDIYMEVYFKYFSLTSMSYTHTCLSINQLGLDLSAWLEVPLSLRLYKKLHVLMSFSLQARSLGERENTFWLNFN